MSRENRNYLHRLIYIYSLLLAAVSLPVSEFLLSLSQFFLAANWFAEGEFKKKWEILKTYKPLQIFLLLYGVHIIWMFNTTNFADGLHDLKIKLPLLVFPVIISTTAPLTELELKRIFRYFNNSVLVATFIMFALFLHCCGFQYDNVKHISVFISHIRFSLMLVLSIFIQLYYFVKNRSLVKNTFLTIGIIIWNIFFLFLLQARTGIVIFTILLPVFLLWSIKQIKNRKILKFSLTSSLVLVILIPIIFIIYSVHRFYQTDKIDFNKLPKYTALHNPYYHNLNSRVVENGHYIWLYISMKELREGWNKISKIPFDSLDRKGQKIKYTIIRYLTSKGLTKDEEGLKHLTPQDVKFIENGATNYLEKNEFSPYYQIYKILWEIDVYRKKEEANNHSVTQRFEFLKAALHIIKNNFWFGVGTGDVRDSYYYYYTHSNTKLKPQFWLRAHNQFVTFWVAFGIIGFILTLIAIFVPIFMTSAHKSFIFNMFILIVLFSFFNEDTLETQMGVTFFSFFYSIFVFGIKKGKDE